MSIEKIDLRFIRMIVNLQKKFKYITKLNKAIEDNDKEKIEKLIEKANKTGIRLVIIENNINSNVNYEEDVIKSLKYKRRTIDIIFKEEDSILKQTFN